MEADSRGPSRRGVLELFGAAAATSASASAALVIGGAPAASASTAGGRTGTAELDGVALLLNGAPAVPGSYSFPDVADTVVFDNGLVRFTFTRDDAAAGLTTGWPDVSITARSVIVNGVELAHNLSGEPGRDPDAEHSFYIDASGGATRLVCSEIRVLRTSADLAEVAFVDTTSTPLRHEHHLIMRRGVRGLYGYDILTAVTDTSINEVRMNTRWDRAIFDHCFNWERGSGQQPTYAYLLTQKQIQDETWQVDGVNNPDLPDPASNSGNLTPGTIYTKYQWSLYHRENPMFGHYGHGFGAWFTPLGGVTDSALCAFYGVGPQHQDLAIHQDALILDYFGANHYGLPSYPLTSGYRRLYGPWLTYLTAGDPNDPDAMIAEAGATARTEIAANREGAGWISDPLYPSSGQRATVTGRVRIADGRPADGLWVLLSIQTATDVYSIHEPTYYVKTNADGTFTLPGIPPAWLPGTVTPGSYTLYIFASKGSITDQYVQTGITVSGASHDLGTITWAPVNRTTFLWQIGAADRMGGEYALAADPVTRANPRSYVKPAQIPGSLTFTVGSSWEPEDWYYAQANDGTWTISFTLDRAYTGTGYLTLSCSMQEITGSAAMPTVAVNGTSAGIDGAPPAGNDSTIARQADRSGYPRLATLSFPASLLTAGANTVTLTRGAGSAAGNGLGWDTLVMEVDEPQATSPAALGGQITSVAVAAGGVVLTLRITNSGAAPANDVRLDSVTVLGPRLAASVSGRDPNSFPVPVAASIPPGGSAAAQVSIEMGGGQSQPAQVVAVTFTANGGRTRGSARAALR